MRIVDELREKIATGLIPPGEKLPSNADLKKTYGVASMTAQNAINRLKSDGLVYGVAGKGVFVRSDIDLDALRQGVASEPVAADDLGKVFARLDELEARVAELEAERGEGGS